MALQDNPKLILSAFLRLARKQDGPVAWVESLQASALTDDASSVSKTLDKLQDQYAKHVSSQDAGSTEWLRGMSCLQIAQLCEAALQILESEAAADEADLPTSIAGSIALGDFSCRHAQFG